MRLSAQSAKIEAGQVRLPRGAKWLDEFRNEVLAFPQGKHDDQLVSMSQALKYMSVARGLVRGLSRQCLCERSLAVNTGHCRALDGRCSKSCRALPQSADHENSLVGKQQSQLRSWQLPVLKIGFFETTILPTSKRLFALLGFAHNPSIKSFPCSASEIPCLSRKIPCFH
jgi:hypothetical protein